MHHVICMHDHIRARTKFTSTVAQLVHYFDLAPYVSSISEDPHTGYLAQSNFIREISFRFFCPKLMKF